MAKAPELYEIMKLSDLSPILEEMEDKHLDSHLTRTKNYTTIINRLEDMETLDDDAAERLITICHKDLISDLQYSSSAIMIITKVLKKIQHGKCGYPANKLVQSALILVRITKKLLTKTLLRKLGFEALLTYPDETLQSLVVSYSDAVINLINYHPELNYQMEITCWISKLIIRILNVLTQNQKQLFVEKGLNTWFGMFLPGVMAAYATDDGTMPDSPTDALQLLTETLKHIDYSTNEKWQMVLKDICDKKRYPMLLKSSLTRGSQHWHTLWKIFIMLLKDQITKVNKTGASPINALLLVVEDAFRMDPSYRCKAFECWNVLIDNFSTGLNESLVEKRLKLLMIPLKLNNAKVEETVLSKLETWWHLIRRFHGKIDKFTDTILIPFLQFCFGKPSDDKTKDGKTVTVPGQMSNALSLKCIEAFVEIVGHKECEGCCTLPRVDSRLITTKLLVEHWSLWLHAFRVAMKTGAENNVDTVIKRMRCLWKGFLTVISELPDNQIRADLVTELLNCVDEFVGPGVDSRVLTARDRDSTSKAQLVFEMVTGFLLADSARLRQLLKHKHALILRIIHSNAVNCYLARNRNLEENITRLKPIALLMFDKSVSDPEQVLSTWLAQNPCMGDVRILLWAAIADTLFETKCNLKALPVSIQKIVLLPFKEELEDDEHESEAIWYRWYKLYDHVQSHVPNCVKLDEDLLQTLSGKDIAPISLKLTAAIALLKQKLVSDKNAELLSVAQILLDVLGMAQGLVPDAMFPILTDTLILLMSKVRTNSTVDLVKITIMLLGVTLKCINISLKNSNDQAKKPIYVETIQEKSKKFLDKLNKNDTFLSLKSIIANTYKIRAEIDYTIAGKTNVSKPIIISNVDVTPKNEKSAEHKEVSDKTNFTTPQPKSAKKTKINKKQPNIVNTVVENGEEFVVVKSNWKFNPKKLTENQKEKFKRKREDIPALYQDLSQSQDEFKLTTWKTDSQDASTSSKSESNSKTNDDVCTVILQKLPSTEVVPKIIENIFPDGANKNKEKTADNVDNDNNNKILEKTPTTKGPKTPRLALKDRVFRNVRNLIEKSGLQDGDNDKTTEHVKENANQTVATVNDNDLKTPISKVKIVNALNSAPSKLTTERPTRSIKKPKKFDDTEIFAMKKKRRASITAECDSQLENNEVLAMKRKRRSSSIAQFDSQPDELIDAEKETKKDQITASEKVDSKEQEEILIRDKNTQNKASPNEPSKFAEPDIAVAKTPETNCEKCPPCDTDNDNKTDQIESTNDKIVIEECKTPVKEVAVTTSNDNVSQVIEEISTPNVEKTNKNEKNPSTTKKKIYRSRIATQLLIDTVEGHPVLQDSQPDKRKTRKNLTPNSKDTVSKRRERLIEKSNKIKAELVSAGIEVLTKDKSKPGPKTTSPKSAQKAVTLPEVAQLSQSVTIADTQDRSFESQDVAMSEDVIESSQDSTLTTISVRSATKKKLPIVRLDKENVLFDANNISTQKLIENEVITLSDTLNDTCNEIGEDIELPKNKTMPEENAKEDLTENMDTEPMDSSGEVILINDEVAAPIVINTEETVVGKETQELAEADTLPMDLESQVPLSVPTVSQSATKEDAIITANKVTVEANLAPDNDITHVSTQDDMTPTLSGPAEVIEDIIVESSNTGSPLKDEIQRKKDFLNDTIEISPIKTLSPVREKKTPSPETSSDYVVIKLTSPVQSNGEPFNEKCDSPEVFTEDKISPDKRDQSPPRKETAPANSSPSSLSLKKNRPQMRFNGRAGQMLGLCVPEKLQILNTERSESDEVRKSPVSTPARRNLKRFYADNEGQANDNESEDSENFLKFTRPLPTAESSPATPILKRKLAEISDESTVSPASKRKRVSFHDPPVSTTVAVQKYIEPCGVRSPSNSAIKRQERQIRALTNAKSAKRLDNVFRLETVLTRTVESFTDDITTTNDTEMSLDETPMAEVVKTSELNDTDPICPELLNCNDPIESIAADLSSPSTKALLIKELEGKVETVADLARMTELEVNRLCIKAPKVKVAKKVLCKYAAEKVRSQEILLTPVTPNTTTDEGVIPEPVLISPPMQPEIETSHNESQTDQVVTKNSDTQTTEVPRTLVHTQTDAVPTTHCAAQTNESGHNSTKDVIATCLKERPDFVDQLSHQLQESSIRQISDKLPLPDRLMLVCKKITQENCTDVVNKVLLESEIISKENHLKIVRDHLCERFDSNDLILFCSELLQKIHKKPL
ncbi:hypothetical protein O0L34_g7352 [Tuta absoluta]|nr:hypothetical protein O0L34_g7352 [Tuta absoluta]